MNNSVKIVINENLKYENFKNFSSTDTIKTLGAGFRLEITDYIDGKLPFQQNDLFSIFVNDVLFKTGYIDTIVDNRKEKEHSVFITGHDRTKDLQDSYLDGKVQIRNPANMKNIIEKVLENLGLDIQVYSNLDLVNFTEKDIMKAEIGKKAFDFLNLYAQRAKVLLNTNEQGNIIIQRAGELQNNIVLLSQKGNERSNIKSSLYEKDFNVLYSKYIFFAQGDISQGDFSDNTISKKAEVLDENVRNGRVFVKVLETSDDIKTLREKAIWERNQRRAKAERYTCVVKDFGYSVSGVNFIWKSNSLITVEDFHRNIHRNFLIETVSFNYDLESGSETELVLVDPNSYTIKAELDYLESFENDKKEEVF